MGQGIFPSITVETAEFIASEWLSVVKNRECGVYIFPKKGDAFKRIEQLLFWDQIKEKYLGEDYRSYFFTSISALPLAIAGTESLLAKLYKAVNPQFDEDLMSKNEFLSKVNLENNFKSYTFCLYDTDEWFINSRIDIFTSLSELSEVNPNIQFLLFLETNITSPELLKNNLGLTTLIQNMNIYSLYKINDIENLINELATNWGFVIDSKSVDKIISKIGLHTWLIKEAVRLYKTKSEIPSNYLDFPTIRLKLEVIWQSFSKSEQSVLLKTSVDNFSFNIFEENSAGFLEKTGFLKKLKGDKFTIIVPILNNFVKEKSRTRSVHLHENKIWHESDDITRLFGEKERSALTILLKNANNIISRDGVASAIWGEENLDHTEWSLDRLMSRLRYKLLSIGVDPKRLKTVKRKGYVWE